jgi:hypothetical protein
MEETIDFRTHFDIHELYIYIYVCVCYSVTLEQWRGRGKRNNLLYFVTKKGWMDPSWLSKYLAFHQPSWRSRSRVSVRISSGTVALMTETSRGFSCSLQANSWALPRLSLNTSFQILAISSVIVPTTLCSSRYWRTVPEFSRRNWGKPSQTSFSISPVIFI